MHILLPSAQCCNSVSCLIVPFSLMIANCLMPILLMIASCCASSCWLIVMASGPSGPSPSSTNKDAIDAGVGNPTIPTPTDTNIGSCGTPNGTDDDGTTLTLAKTRKFISDIWEHFTLEVRDDVDKAICKYCKNALGGSSKNGTKHLRYHQRSCPMKRYRNIVKDFAVFFSPIRKNLCYLI